MNWDRFTRIVYTSKTIRSTNRYRVIESRLSTATRICSVGGRVFSVSPGLGLQNEIFLHRDLNNQMKKLKVVSVEYDDSNYLDIEKIASELHLRLGATRYSVYNWEMQCINRKVYIRQFDTNVKFNETYIRFTALHEESGRYCAFNLDNTNKIEIVDRVLKGMDSRLQESLCNIDLFSSLSLMWTERASNALAKAIAILLQDDYLHGNFPYAISPLLRSDFPKITLYRESSADLVDDTGLNLQRLLVVKEGAPLAWDLPLARSSQLGIPIMGGQFYDEHSHIFQNNTFSLECDEISSIFLKQEYILIEDAEYINYLADKDVLFIKVTVNNKCYLSNISLKRLLLSLYQVMINSKKYFICKL